MVEINGTDSDAGLQIFLDGDDWVSVKVRDPNGKKIYEVNAGGGAAEQGLTENFFESAEPSCTDDPLVDFLERFPEGEFEAIGRSTENEFLEGVAILTHDLPAIPESLAANNTMSVELSWVWPGTEGPADLGEFCDDEGLANVLTDSSDLFGFQVVVGREAPEPLLELVVELGPLANSIVLPDDFIEANGTYKWEVIAIGQGVDPDNPGVFDPMRKGNQTIAEDEFCTDGAGLAGAC